MLICGYQKTTLLDYPGHVAATVFTGGCNFRCPFCHNTDLVLHPASMINTTKEEFMSFLNKRKPILSGICITGGEPTLQSDLPDFIKEIKELGYLVKLDTNGYMPTVLEDLLSQNLLDYIAMDIKAGSSHYAKVSGLPALDMELIKRSIAIIENSGIPYEFRTTVVKELHTENDFYEIRDMLSPYSPYYIQSFKDSGNIMSEGLHSCKAEILQKYLSIIQTKLSNVSLRGID